MSDRILTDAERVRKQWASYMQAVELEREETRRRRRALALWIGAVALLAGWLAGRCL